VKNQVSLTLKKINNKLKNLKRNTPKTTFILSIYVSMTNAKNTRNAKFATITIATYNNINQQRQLKKTKKKKDF
jgi:hypothetical protein